MQNKDMHVTAHGYTLEHTAKEEDGRVCVCVCVFVWERGGKVQLCKWALKAEEWALCGFGSMMPGLHLTTARVDSIFTEISFIQWEMYLILC